MSSYQGESSIPYIHYKSRDLFRGKFNIQVLAVVGSGYAGKVVRCVLSGGQRDDDTHEPDTCEHRTVECDRCNGTENSMTLESNETHCECHLHENEMSQDCGCSGKSEHSADKYCVNSEQQSGQVSGENSRDAWAQTEADPTDEVHRHQEIAIKIIGKSKVKPRAVENEVKLLSMATGANVLQYITSVECRDSYWIITEYCSRGDLYSLLKHMDSINIMTRYFLSDVVAGLECLHGHLIAHSDIKMKNILITDQNVAKLADFGFARMYSSLDAEEYECRGTKDYWAPEMCLKDSSFNPFKADIYALGVTFAGVCRKSPVKKKYDNIYSVIGTFEDLQQIELFNGLLHVDPDQRFNFENIKSNPWLTGTALINMKKKQV